MTNTRNQKDYGRFIRGSYKIFENIENLDPLHCTFFTLKTAPLPEIPRGVPIISWETMVIPCAPHGGSPDPFDINVGFHGQTMKTYGKTTGWFPTFHPHGLTANLHGETMKTQGNT